MNNFCDDLWDQNLEIINRIENHPFNQELVKGILPKEKFIFYLFLDSHYLIDFSKSLAIIASRLNDENHIHQFLKFSQGSLVAERDLHQKYLKNENISLKVSPTCLFYTSFLLRMACNAPIASAMAAVLPCFLVYAYVGKKMFDQANANRVMADHPYRDWIIQYSSPEFFKQVERMKNIFCDYVAKSQLSKNDLKNATDAFRQSTWLELKFWQSAYDCENW